MLTAYASREPQDGSRVTVLLWATPGLLVGVVYLIGVGPPLARLVVSAMWVCLYMAPIGIGALLGRIGAAECVVLTGLFLAPLAYHMALDVAAITRRKPST